MVFAVKTKESVSTLSVLSYQKIPGIIWLSHKPIAKLAAFAAKAYAVLLALSDFAVKRLSSNAKITASRAKTAISIIIKKNVNAIEPIL